MKGFIRCLSAALLIAASTVSAHDRVSADSDPVVSAIFPVGLTVASYNLLDISSNGRYVLYSNISPRNEAPVSEADQAGCTIYRRDRLTGALLEVFSSSAATRRYYCGSALMSDDGNTIVTAPGTGVDNVCVNNTIDFIESRDIAAGTSRSIPVDVAGDPRLCVGGPRSGVISGGRIVDTSRDASLVLYDEPVNYPYGYYSLIDVPANTITLLDDYLDAVLPGAGQQYLPVALGLGTSGDTIAVRVHAWADGFSLPTFYPPPQPCRFACEPPDEDAETRVYVIDRVADSATELDSLTTPYAVPLPNTLATAFGDFETLELSGDESALAWIERPLFCADIGPCKPVLPLPVCTAFSPTCVPDFEVCVDEECELQFFRHNIGADRTEQFSGTPYSPAPPQLGARAQFSSNLRFALYARQPADTIANFQPSPRPPNTCVNRASVDSLGAPLIETCAANYATLTQPTAMSPLLWHQIELDTGIERNVSVHASTQFRSTKALMSADAGTLVFQSHDPRLFAGTSVDLTGVAGVGESSLADECFWNASGAPGNVRLIGNDNLSFATFTDQYVYPGLSTFCLAPTPAITGEVFATDQFVGGTFVPANIARSSGSSLGPWLLLLLGWYGVTRYLRRAD